RRRHTRSKRDWSSDVCSSDLNLAISSQIVHMQISRSRAKPQQFQCKGASPNPLTILDPPYWKTSFQCQTIVLVRATNEIRRILVRQHITNQSLKVRTIRLWTYSAEPFQSSPLNS